MSALSDMVARLDYAIRTLDRAIRLATQAADTSRAAAKKFNQAGEGADHPAPGNAATGASQAAREAGLMAAALIDARDKLITYTCGIRSRYRPPADLAIHPTAVTGDTAGGGSGPWVDRKTKVRKGGAVAQTCPGSCVSACGEMLSNGTVSQQEFLDELGEWCRPEDLKEALNSRAGARMWHGGPIGTGDEALIVAQRGTMGAALMAPGCRSMHMVVIESKGAGRFLVRDPQPGVTYEVNAEWIKQYVASGVYR